MKMFYALPLMTSSKDSFPLLRNPCWPFPKFYYRSISRVYSKEGLVLLEVQLLQDQQVLEAKIFA
jgi:hypothetical protein